MQIRIVVLLLLCLSSGMGATLGHYQTQAKEAPGVDTAAVEAPEQETTAANGTVADAPVIVEAPVADSPTAEESVAETIVAAELVAEIPAADNPAAEDPEVVEPETETDDMMGDISALDAMEALIGEALAHEAPDEDEGGDSRAVQTDQSLGRPLTQEEESSWSLSSIRDSFQTVNGYFDSLVELVGGRNGVCQYRCRYGKSPQPRPGYQVPEPNGCSSFLMGYQFDLGIPAMTKCCDQLDVCYDTCGTSKYHCDGSFRRCVHGICSDLKKSLGFVSKVQACESVADALYNTVWTLGCRPYMNSQRAACLCEEEDKDEL